MYPSRSNAPHNTEAHILGSSSMMYRGESYKGTYPNQSGYDQSAPYPSRAEPSAQATAPALHRSAGLPRKEPAHRSDLGSRGLFSKGASNGAQRGYDQAMAVLSRDETFDHMAAASLPDVDEVGDGPYDPNDTIRAQQNSLYVLMKNENMINAKNVKEIMEMAAFIWQNIYKVKLPLISIPETRKEFVYFRMMSLEDKMKALTMSENKAVRKSKTLHFMGKPTLVKDLPVSPLSFLIAQPGSHQGALDALMPLRGIKYEDQIAARSDSIKNMLKSVVLSARKALNLPERRSNKMARCFFDEPELKEFIPMGTSSGFARFTTLEFGEHPVTGKPTPGIRVYYGPDVAPLVYLLPLEDCTHISPTIVKTVEYLFGFLTNEGFAIYDPKYARGLSLLKFRVMMSTSGRMIITIELALDDNYAAGFEEIVPKNNTDPRRLYQPVPDPPLIPSYPFMKENSLDEVPPIRDLMKYGGFDDLSRIRPALERFHNQYGKALGVEGIYVTWYYVNERPIEWNRNTRIWHHACGGDFVSEYIMDVHLPMYPHILSIHFPHTQAFPKILKEIVENAGIDGNSRVIVLSDYLFLAEFFGQTCLRTIFLKNEVTEHERDYLEQSLPPNAIKFLSTLSKPKVESLEPGGDVVIIWGGNRREKVLRNIGFANYRLVVFVRDGLKRVKPDKQDTFVSLVTIARCLFPYMALEGAVAIDLEPQGNTMPALITFFSKAPYAPKIPEVESRASLKPAPTISGNLSEPPSPPPAPIISMQHDYECPSPSTSLAPSPYYQSPLHSSEINPLRPYERQYVDNVLRPPKSTNKYESRPLPENDFGPRPTPREHMELRLTPGNEFKGRSTRESESRFEPRSPPGNKYERQPSKRDRLEPRLTLRDEFESSRARLEPWPTPGNKFESHPMKVSTLEPRSTPASKFEPITSPRDRLEPWPTPGNKFEPSPSQRDRKQPWPTPGNKLDARPSKGSTLQPRSTPGNTFEPTPSPRDRLGPWPTPGNKFEPTPSPVTPSPSKGSTFEPSSTPGSSFEPTPSPRDRLEPWLTPRNKFEPSPSQRDRKQPWPTPGNELDARPMKGSVLEPRSTPGNTFEPTTSPRDRLEPWPTPRNKFEPSPSQRDRKQPWPTPGNELDARPMKGSVLEPRSTPGNTFEPTTSPRDRLEPWPTPRNKFEPSPSQRDRKQPRPTPGNELDARPMKGSALEPRSTPGNTFEPTTSPRDRLGPWPTPGNKFEPTTSPVTPSPSKGSTFEPSSTPGNSFEPTPSPRDRLEPWLTPGNKFEPSPSQRDRKQPWPTPGNELDARPMKGSALEPRSTPGNTFEPTTSPRDRLGPWPTPGNKFEPTTSPVTPSPSKGSTFEPPSTPGSSFEPTPSPRDRLGPWTTVGNESGSGPDLSNSSINDPPYEADDVELIMDFVWRNGGHKNIDKITLDRSIVGWKMLYNLQKSLRNQKNKGRITIYPFWYHKYLYEYEPDVKLPPDVKIPPSLAKDTINLPAKLPKVPPQPSKATSVEPEPPRKILRMDTGRSTVTPPDSRQKSQPAHEDSDEEGGVEKEDRKAFDVQFICEYIWKNGGHAKLMKMKLDQSVLGWQLLRKIQKTARNISRKGKNTETSLPIWYREIYVPQFEPYLVLPAESGGS